MSIELTDLLLQYLQKSLEKLTMENQQPPDFNRNPFINVEDTANNQLTSSKPHRMPLRSLNANRKNKEFFQTSLCGQGNFGVVTQCINRLDGKNYAIKKTQSFVEDQPPYPGILNEVWAYAAVSAHPNIVKYFSSWIEKTGDEENDKWKFHAYIQIEFCSGGTLKDMLNCQSMSVNSNKEEILKLLHQIGSALEHLHSYHLVHLDIKPDNIMIHHRCYKLGDFGTCVSTKAPLEVEEIGGDPLYIAPELVSLSYKQNDLPKADIFSLGLTLCEMAGLKLPTPKDPEWNVLRSTGGSFPAVNKLILPNIYLYMLLKKMIAIRPSKRPSSGGLLLELENIKEVPLPKLKKMRTA